MLNLLIHTAKVLRPSITAGTVGGASYSYSTLIPSLQCLVQPKTVQEIDEAGKITARIFYRLYCVWTSMIASITHSDIVEIDGQRYEIIGIVDAAGLGRIGQIDLRRKE
ncbi:MAG TPA: hypothetical protein PLX18_11535 [Anaerohalosphaeraceae bacterium]|nr:hypothetical protein [Anaerohalosphaeraceae bacterium]HQG06811.1 hypothetical protein [Anaerohalosphaeraceae bacterium]HQI08474.1 hypothetical protein [Anaerohalosphaeraceae bacterium]HQJ68906.1 hypothetical protein [Anaerohalosphaeraceae bacterium]